MPGKSTLVALDLAILLPASDVSLPAVEFVVTHHWPRPRRRGSHTVAGKFGACRSGLAKNCDHRPAPGAACASFVGRAPVLTASPKPTIPRPTSCRLAANAQAAK